MKKVTGLAAALATIASMAGAQEFPITKETNETLLQLETDCEFFKTNDQQRKCSKAIVREFQELANSTIDIMQQKGISGTVVKAQCFVSDELQAQLDSSDAVISLEAMGEYTQSCLNVGINNAIEQDLSTVDIMRMFAVNNFRIVALGYGVPKHPFANQMQQELKTVQGFFKGAGLEL
jgi:methanogenic corrinoid protein MtbC1